MRFFTFFPHHRVQTVRGSSRISTSGIKDKLSQKGNLALHPFGQGSDPPFSLHVKNFSQFIETGLVPPRIDRA